MYICRMYCSIVHTRLIHALDMYVQVYARWVGFQMSWDAHLEPRFSVYAWCIQRISHVYAVLTDIHCVENQTQNVSVVLANR